MESEKPSIIEWYKQQTVFVTGGTGFMGKALIFKLLQCGVQRIYILTRTKKGQNPEDRINTISQHEIFDSIRAIDPNFRSRLFPICGDVTEPMLDIPQEDLRTLEDDVTVIFHVAASVQFNNPLKAAVFYNLRSTQDLVDLAKNFRKLKMFHYVSTAYSNCELMHAGHAIEEKVYREKLHPRKLITFVETAPEQMVEAMELKILGSSVNTYIFTKHLAEAVVRDAGLYIPVVISRPEIVLNSWKEPYPGWMDNLSSPTAICGGIAKGILRINFGNHGHPKAYVCVDIAINNIMTSTWREVNKEELDMSVNVYHMHFIPMSGRDVKDTGMEVSEYTPFYQGLWHPQMYEVGNSTLFLLLHILLHVIPGILVDTMLRLSGKPPRLVKIYRKLYMAFIQLEALVSSTDQFELTNYHKLEECIPEKERDVFPVRMFTDRGTWLKLLVDGSRGFRKLMGEPIDISEQEFIHARRLKWIDRAFKGLLIFAAVWYFPFGAIWSRILSFLNFVLEP